jgi:sigma-B regulation protein RsbU (phosphoserine phosphatase)
MSLSSTSTTSGRGTTRVVTAVAVAVAVLAPLAVLCAQVWSSTGSARSFTADERRGVAYLEPLTQLLSATTEAQSAAVRGKPVDAASVRAAVTAVDQADQRLGRALRTSDRWTIARQTVQQRLSVTSWQPSTAYTQYSDLNTALLELTRTVGDNSRLILDPAIDTYYVMSASLLRIPEILVDSGRYADLSVLFPNGGGGDATQAQLAAARNRIATDEADLSDGLVKAFAQTDSSTLGPELTRQLDNFRTAADAVAPSTSLLAPVPERSVTDLIGNQDALERAALSLQQASLGQLDALLAERAAGQTRSRIVALVATAVGVLVAIWLVALVWRRPSGRPRHQAEPDPDRAPTAAAYRQANGTTVPVRSERPGGARAAR